ncbi:hypothetical protein QGN32_07505 [Mycolicibacterium sp. ND9-15]|uniref:hypothetical protein n=1 Tax=Mycolicibacterium sp. ND9-15 TaxID=3042320 RepID=UPI002DD9FC11|nr:hypothetical protein [Mycolicibacterium sp. ND9-15]WSE57704.1 hypothetical protein QGN32_07505 [Mycolicibacterium sp. ND9-15]
MNTNTIGRVARFVALSAVSGGILAGALGFAGAASAGTYTPDDTPRPGIIGTPNTIAHPPQVRYRHGVLYLEQVQPSYHR